MIARRSLLGKLQMGGRGKAMHNSLSDDFVGISPKASASKATEWWCTQYIVAIVFTTACCTGEHEEKALRLFCLGRWCVIRAYPRSPTTRNNHISYIFTYPSKCAMISRTSIFGLTYPIYMFRTRACAPLIPCPASRPPARRCIECRWRKVGRRRREAEAATTT